MRESADIGWWAERFETQRPRLRGIAYRMLGSIPDAEDAVQEAWVRLARTDRQALDNLDAWLTTVVGRVCLNVLRARQAGRSEAFGVHLPDPVVGPADSADPEHEFMLADSVGLALLVVLETLGPAERVAFVLHDVLATPFDEIGRLIERTPEAARQLASRARRRIRDAAPSPDTGLIAQREVVDAFFAAARDGDFDRLVGLLHPGVVLRADFGPGAPGVQPVTRGAAGVAARALFFAGRGRVPRPATVNGAAGMVVTADGGVVSVMGFTVRQGRIASIDVLGDPIRLAALDLPVTF